MFTGRFLLLWRCDDRVLMDVLFEFASDQMAAQVWVVFDGSAGLFKMLSKALLGGAGADVFLYCFFAAAFKKCLVHMSVENQ